MPTSAVTGGNWVECHKQSLDDPLVDDTIDELKLACFRDKVMMGCKKTSSSSLEVLAWAPRDIVFEVTDKADCGNDGTVTYKYYEDIWEWSSIKTKTRGCDALYCQRDVCGINGPEKCAVCDCNDAGNCQGTTANGVKWYRTEGDQGQGFLVPIMAKLVCKCFIFKPLKV